MARRFASSAAKATAAIGKSSTQAGPFRVLVSGASGMLGQALQNSLAVPKPVNRFQPEVHTLVRHAPRNGNEIYWDPYEGDIEIEKLEGFDAVVHLAGENIGSGEGLFAATGRWTDRKMHTIMESRRRGTQLLSRALASVTAPPGVLVSASGVGYYGDCGDKEILDGSPKGSGFLAEVSDVWEKECKPASDGGIRVVNTRFGVVLSRNGGALQKLLPPILFGVGGPVGSGSQYMSYISLADAVRVIEHCIVRPVSGPVNACAPEGATNAQLIKAIGSNVMRPTLFPLPEAVVKAVFGQMGEETLLVSQRAVPNKLLDSGFRFRHPNIQAAVDSALGADGGWSDAL